MTVPTKVPSNPKVALEAKLPPAGRFAGSTVLPERCLEPCGRPVAKIRFGAIEKPADGPGAGYAVVSTTPPTILRIIAGTETVS